MIRCSVRLNSRRPNGCWLVGIALVLLGSFSLPAATNFVDAYRATARASTSGWGRVNLGTSVGVTSDPSAAAIADLLRRASNGRSTASGTLRVTAASLRSKEQDEALERLAARSGPGMEVHLRPGSWTVMQLRGGILEWASASGAAIGLSVVAQPADPLETARRFLRKSRAALLLDDPDHELALERAEFDELGRWHFRFSQQLGALPVWPAGLGVHLDQAGNVDLVDGAYIPTPAGIATEPVVGAAAAAERARGSVPEGSASRASAPVLVVYAPLHGVSRLAWKTEVTVGLTRAWVVLVDALDGQVLNRITQVCDTQVATSALDLEGVRRDLTVWSAAGKFYLADTSKPSYDPGFDPIANPRGVITVFDAREVTEQDLNTVFIVESPNVGQWLPDGVSAAFNFAETFDYFFERHARNSVDGQGGNVRAAVRVAEMDNAFWNGNQQMMFFGNVRPYPAALDVVGHELAHGVTQHTADLIYELQPGALNESFSDIFGEMVEARTEGQPDWKIGTRLGQPFRDMKDPGSMQIGGLNRPFPSKMSEFIELPNRVDTDHGGVHLNSSIFNHCFYLLAEGLPGAIGMGDAERIFYRCLSQHLQKQSQFVDARLGCIAAAEALFGVASTQAVKTAEAFDTVEIFSTPPTPPPPPLPPVAGADSTLLLAYDPFIDEIALGRRETALGDPTEGVLLVDFVKVARPSVAGDGSFAVFVDASNDLGFVETANPDALELLGLPGRVHSVAMSPDGVQFAFVLRDPATGVPDNRITVLDLVEETERTFDLLVPVLDGNPADLVLYADSMVFTSDGRQLLYDAVSELRFGDGTPVQRWSIYRMDLTTETTTVLVPPLEGYHTGNPNLGRAGNRYLTFDATELASGLTVIVNLDLFTGDLGIVGAVGDGLGYPCFSGDESAVIYVFEDPEAFWNGYSLARQTLSANRLEPVGSPTTWLPDALLGVTYRRGTFTNSNAPPVVHLTAPADGTAFAPGSTITLSATATDSDGISRVEFYDRASKIGEDTTSPYEFVWSNVGAGNYRLLARATDTLGGSADSGTVQIAVGQTQAIQVAAVRLANQSLRITVTAAPGSYVVEESSNLAQWSNAFTLTVGAAGTGSVDDDRSPPIAGGRFFRVRLN